MLSKKIVIRILAVCVAATLIFSGGGGVNAQPQSEATPEASSPKVILNLSHVMAPTELYHLEFEKMVERINERSNGSLEIRIFPGGQLGSQKDNLEQIVRGVNLITFTDPAQMADYVPDYGIMFSPFIYDTPAHIDKLAGSSWHDEIKEAASQRGLKVLDMGWYYGNRHLISNQVIETPEDLRGVQVRVPSVTMWVYTVEAIGGVPTNIQWSELYTALSQNVVQAAEGPLPAIYASRLYEVCKNIALTGHFTATCGLVMSQVIFDTMTEEQQTILLEEVRAAGKAGSEITLASEDDLRREMEAEGVQFNEVDNQAFKNASRVVFDRFPEWSPGLYEKIAGILNQ